VAIRIHSPRLVLPTAALVPGRVNFFTTVLVVALGAALALGLGPEGPRWRSAIKAYVARAGAKMSMRRPAVGTCIENAAGWVCDEHRWCWGAWFWFDPECWGP
jgi:hypothetical protein